MFFRIFVLNSVSVLSFFVLIRVSILSFFVLNRVLKVRASGAGPHLPTQGYIEYPPPPGSTRTLVWILFFPLFRTRLVNVSQSIGPAVQSRRGTCRLSLVGIGQGTLVCLEIGKTNIISIFGFEGVSSFISTAPCYKSQIHLF